MVITISAFSTSSSTTSSFINHKHLNHGVITRTIAQENTTSYDFVIFLYLFWTDYNRDVKSAPTLHPGPCLVFLDPAKKDLRSPILKCKILLARNHMALLQNQPLLCTSISLLIIASQHCCSSLLLVNTTGYYQVINRYVKLSMSSRYQNHHQGLEHHHSQQYHQSIINLCSLCILWTCIITSVSTVHIPLSLYF